MIVSFIFLFIFTIVMISQSSHIFLKEIYYQYHCPYKSNPTNNNHINILYKVIESIFLFNSEDYYNNNININDNEEYIENEDYDGCIHKEGFPIDSFWITHQLKNLQSEVIHWLPLLWIILLIYISKRIIIYFCSKI